MRPPNPAGNRKDLDSRDWESHLSINAGKFFLQKEQVGKFYNNCKIKPLALINVKRANIDRVFPKKCFWSPQVRNPEKVECCGAKLSHGHDLEVL